MGDPCAEPANTYEYYFVVALFSIVRDASRKVNVVRSRRSDLVK